MDYVGNLIKAQRALLSKIKEMAERDSETYYYEKYEHANSDNLELKEKLANAEFKITQLEKELTNKNNLIQQLSK
jgi:hypothetical protein